MSARDELAAAVVGQGALPVPAGDVLPLSAERVAEIAGRAAHLYEYGGDADADVDEWNALAGSDVPALVAEIRRLWDERHSTNEALDDAVRELRARQVADVGRSADKLTRLLAPTQALRERPGEFEAALHHGYAKGRDLPETGGA